MAGKIGRPGAARAVGGALGRNPLPIVIPCHRVIRSDGSLGGFGAGLDWKKRLLALEAEKSALGEAKSLVCRARLSGRSLGED